MEVVNFVRLGMTPLEAVRTATAVNAEMLRMDDRIGTIRPGMEAGLIAVAGNRLEDIRPLQDVLVVIRNGGVAMSRLPFAR